MLKYKINKRQIMQIVKLEQKYYNENDNIINNNKFHYKTFPPEEIT